MTGFIPEHPLVADLVKDPSSVPDLRCHAGFVGRSVREGYFRLYTAENLQEFVDLPEGCLRRVEVVPSSVRYPVGAHAIWVEPAGAADKPAFRKDGAQYSISVEELTKQWAPRPLGIPARGSDPNN
jgi:hypothetical protein